MLLLEEPFFNETGNTAPVAPAEVDKNDTKKVEKKLESKNTEAQEAAKKATEQKQIYELLTLCEQLLSDEPLFFLLNSYTAGLSPSVMKYLVSSVIADKRGGTVECDEIGIPVTDSKLVLPCGNTAVWLKN